MRLSRTVPLYSEQLTLLLEIFHAWHYYCNSDPIANESEVDLGPGVYPPYARVSRDLLEMSDSVALSFPLCLLLVAVHLVACKQFTLNVPQVRGGEEGYNTDAFGAVVASRRHCVPASRQAKATTFPSTGVKRISYSL